MAWLNEDHRDRRWSMRRCLVTTGPEIECKLGSPPASAVVHWALIVPFLGEDNDPLIGGITFGGRDYV